MNTQAKKPANNPWPKRLSAAKKFMEKFHERGDLIEKRYEDERDDTTAAYASTKRVNLFFSNVSIQKESLFNSLPKPEVGRLHKGDYENDAARVAALVMQRALSYEVHCARSFDPAIKAAIQDRLVPGLGTTWISFVPAEGDTPEEIAVDIVYWKDLIYEPRRSWEDVRWCGRKTYILQSDAEARWPSKTFQASDAENARGSNTTATDQINKNRVCIIQMWDKTKRKVLHLTEEGDILDTVDDPYKLPDFFPCPKPLIASPSTRKFLPTSDYYIAQDQYEQIDVTYARMSLIVEALRVSGVYDGSQPEIARMLSGAENKLIPVDNWAMFAEKGGVKGSIDWFPVDQVASVLQQLVTVYEFLKQQLFEVTGMADIVRGASNQYETARAQQIKAQFASVRLNGLQRDVATFVRDTLRIMAGVMCSLYSDEKLKSIVGTLDPADNIYVPQAIPILRNHFLRKYNIDIEADSLTQADWSLESEQRMSYVQALSGFLTSAVPAVQQFPSLGPLLLTVIKFASVGFRGAAELEGVIDRGLEAVGKELAQSGGQKAPSPEEIKAQGEQQKLQMEMQSKQQEFELKKQEGMMKLEMQREQMALKREEHMMDMQMKREEMAFQREKHMMDMQQAREKAELQAGLQAAQGEQKLQQSQAQGMLDLAQREAAGQQSLAQSAQQGEQKLAQQKAAAKAPRPGGKPTK